MKTLGLVKSGREMSNKALFLADEAVQGKPQEFMAGLAKSDYQERNSPPYPCSRHHYRLDVPFHLLEIPP